MPCQLIGIWQGPPSEYPCHRGRMKFRYSANGGTIDTSNSDPVLSGSMTRVPSEVGWVVTHPTWLTVPVLQRPSSSNGGSAVSARVVTTMVLARVGAARPPRTRQQAVTKIAIKPRVTLFVCIMVLRLELVLKVGRSCHCEELEATKQSLFRQRLLRSARKDSILVFFGQKPW